MPFIQSPVISSLFDFVKCLLFAANDVDCHDKSEETAVHSVV